MKAGIIAAGEGSRLAQSRPGTVKPMIIVAGKPLIHWVVDGLRSAGCREITVLTNTRGAAVAPYLSSAFPSVEFSFLTADTASSFESFRLVCLSLAEKSDSFVVSTVDALISPEDVSRFVVECGGAKADAGLALTRFVDDEKPLWADLDGTGFVTALGDAAKTKSFVTSGLYYATRKAAGLLPEASAHGRLRDFLGSLVAAGARVSGVVLTKTLDVDRPDDLEAAELFLTTETKR
jgi:NDP-sugar pyrophosphorylase family protein